MDVLASKEDGGKVMHEDEGLEERYCRELADDMDAPHDGELSWGDIRDDDGEDEE
jgi:hypothetical protein